MEFITTLSSKIISRNLSRKEKLRDGRYRLLIAGRASAQRLTTPSQRWSVPTQTCSRWNLTEDPLPVIRSVITIHKDMPSRFRQ